MNKNLKIPELLAPVGGMDQLKSAINFGTDAVYLAMKQFGMRARAQNFSYEELCQAINLAHSNGVKVYITANIMMHENNISQLNTFFIQLQKAQVDAIIVSDLGAFSLAKKIIPNIDIHISTQAATANSQSIKMWKKLGAKRVVLARELSLDEIKQVTSILSQDKTQIELETFIHGAMCMSISGRCLISSYLTGRSANKGACTQPCRWGYKLIEEGRKNQVFDIEEDSYGTYLMNSKDLNMSQHLHEFINLGISSIKIEGRNKKEMYVGCVVNIYRHLLDALKQDLKNNNSDNLDYNNCLYYKQAIKKWCPEFNNISHRPYSTGFYFHEAQQSQDYDGYEQNRIHCATVISSTNKDGNYLIKVICKNRFEENENLEAVVPNSEILQIKPENLYLENTKKVNIANRANKIYSFISEINIPKNSLIRSKTFLRTSRLK